MLRLVLVAFAVPFLAASPAIADYRIHFAQLDGAGNEIESGVWRCLDFEMKANRCTQVVPLVIDDNRVPIEFRLHDDGGILHVTMAAGARLLEVRRQPLRFHRKGALKVVAAGQLEPWESMQRVDHDLNDLVLRSGYRPLPVVTLIVERFAGEHVE